MGLILSIETATSVCSVALHGHDGAIVGIIELFQDSVHGQKLMPAIESLLQQVGIEKEGLDAIAVSMGPGSYTGLRIGVSTAKGMAYALDIPLIGIDTLDALGRRSLPFVGATDSVVPMMDARRMEVYCKVLDSQMNELAALSPVVVDEASFDTHLMAGKVVFLGDANEKVREVISHENAVFIPFLNSASTVGELAAIKYKQKQFEDVAYFEPNYLKEFRVLKSKKALLI